MTELETHRPSYVPTGRPVRRFVVAQVVLAVLFAALWWSGLVAPRLGSRLRSTGPYDRASGQVTAKLDLHNTSPVAVEVRSVTLGDGRLKVDSVQVNGRDIATGGHRLAGGGVATMVIEFACRPAEDDDRLGGPRPVWIGLEITVRTPIGLERTRPAGRVSLHPACVG